MSKDKRQFFTKNPLRGIEARNKLFEENIKLAHKFVANKIRRNTRLRLIQDDLLSDVFIGLMSACEMFDETKGFKISTYAHYWMEQAYSRGWMKRNRLIHVPIYALCEKVETPVVERMSDFFSENIPCKEDDRDYERDEIISNAIKDALRFLSKKERQVIEMRLDGMSLQGIGDLMGLTKERIRQIETAGRGKLLPRLWRLQTEI